MYPVVEIHSRDSGRAIFAGRNQRQRGRPPTLRSHAAATVVSAVWVAICGNVRSCPIVGVFVVLLWAVEGEDVQANAAESM